MLPAIVWALVFLAVVGLIVWRIDHQVTAYLTLIRQQHEKSEAEREVELLERRNAAERERLAIDEHAAVDKAKLLDEAARIKRDGEIALATLDDRIEAEKKVIEASIETRVLAASQQASQNTSRSTLDALTDAYKTYVEYVDSDEILTFGQWAQGFNLPGN